MPELRPRTAPTPPDIPARPGGGSPGGTARPRTRPCETVPGQGAGQPERRTTEGARQTLCLRPARCAATGSPRGSQSPGRGGERRRSTEHEERSTNVTQKPEVVIIGAGPAGLTAGWELVKRGVPATIVEGDSVVGGISRTAQREGWRFDIGGHRFFTK